MREAGCWMLDGACDASGRAWVVSVAARDVGVAAGRWDAAGGRGVWENALGLLSGGWRGFQGWRSFVADPWLPALIPPGSSNRGYVPIREVERFPKRISGKRVPGDVRRRLEDQAPYLRWACAGPAQVGRGCPQPAAAEAQDNQARQPLWPEISFANRYNSFSQADG